MRVLKFVGCKHCVGPAHLLVKTHSWACLLKPTKSALWFNAKLSMHGKVWLLLMRSDAKLPKSACHSLGNDLGVWDTLKLKRKKERKQRPLGLKWRAEAQRAIRPIFVWVPERAKHRKGRVSTEMCSPKNREKHSESVKEWKRKMRLFFFLKLHKRKINW